MKPDTVYIDPHSRFAIGYFAQIPEGFGHYVHQSADDWENVNKTMVIRAVYSLEDLDEKIAIFEDGLDDIPVQRLKFFLANFIEPRLKKSFENLRYAHRERVPEWIDDVENGAIVFSCFDPERKETVHLRMSMAWYYDHVLACEFDLRMKLPDEFSAFDTGNKWIELMMNTDPGSYMPYFRSYHVDGSDYEITAVTMRKTKHNPTLRLYGLRAPNGITIFPPVFVEVNQTQNDLFMAVANGSPYVISPNGGLFDLFQRHLPPIPEIDYNDYLPKLATWVFDGLKIFYRDSSIDMNLDEYYERGAYIRAGFFIDSTGMLKNPAPGVKVRFLIMSAHGVPLNNVKGISENNPVLTMWDLNVFHYNSIFKVMDVFKGDGITQITLLQVPPSAIEILNDEKGWAFLNEYAAESMIFEGQSIVEKAHNDLMEALSEEIHPLSLNKEWQQRTSELIGVTPDGTVVGLDPVEQIISNEIKDFENLLLSFTHSETDIIPKFTLHPRMFGNMSEN